MSSWYNQNLSNQLNSQFISLSSYLKKNFLRNTFSVIRSIIGEVRYGFLRIFAPTPYSTVFLVYASAPAPIKIGIGVVLRFRFDSFGLDWTSPNINFNLKTSFLH